MAMSRYPPPQLSEGKSMGEKGRFSYQKLLQALEKGYGGPIPAGLKGVFKIAFEGHHGQFRISRDPEQRLPYIVHPVGTALMTMRYLPIAHNMPDNLETIVCTALTHDLLEDSRVDGVTLEAIAGSRVRAYVEALTKPPAGLGGKSPEERNREFVDQIVEAGPAAAFVKLCDSMHNLSRPASTPLDLYRKLVIKAKTQYLPLLDHCPLGEDFRNIYEEAINKAEAHLAQEEQYIKPKAPPASLQAAMAEGVAAAASKIIELHDLTTILSHACCAPHTSIWQLGPGEDWLLRETSGPPISSLGTLPRGLAVSEAPQIFGEKIKNKGRRGEAGQEAATTFTIPMHLDPTKRFLVALNFGEKGPPAWLSLEAATMIVQFLAHRLIVSAADWRSELATNAARIGLQLDTDLAFQVGLRPADLAPLQQWRTRCQQAIAVVEYLIRIFLIDFETGIPLRDLVRVESRVKSINSLLRKFAAMPKLSWPEYDNVEDTAGVRVICPTRSILQAVEEFLLSTRAKAAGVCLHSGMDDARRDYVRTPTTSGYKAIHLILEVETYLQEGGSIKVPCEVQLRTIFQHNWASISHQALYKDRKVGQSPKELLKELGEALERCEELAERLIGQAAD